jgi:hypothetical protein
MKEGHLTACYLPSKHHAIFVPRLHMSTNRAAGCEIGTQDELMRCYPLQNVVEGDHFHSPLRMTRNVYVESYGHGP